MPFSPLIGGLAGITFGPGPPEPVSPPGSIYPVMVTRSGSGLRLAWEDLGPTVTAYNIYEGTLGARDSHAPLLCHVAGSPGRGSDGRRRPLPHGSCGAAPPGGS